MLSRELQRAAHRFADHTSSQLAQVPAMRGFLATVSGLSAGAAADGNALVTVLWRGEDVLVASYGSTYTPAVGDRVLCLVVDGQVVITDKQIGYP